MRQGRAVVPSEKNERPNRADHLNFGEPSMRVVLTVLLLGASGMASPKLPRKMIRPETTGFLVKALGNLHSSWPQLPKFGFCYYRDPYYGDDFIHKWSIVDSKGLLGFVP